MGKVLSGLKRLGKEFFLFSGVLSVWLFVTNMIVLVINYWVCFTHNFEFVFPYNIFPLIDKYFYLMILYLNYYLY